MTEILIMAIILVLVLIIAGDLRDEPFMRPSPKIHSLATKEEER